MKTKGCGRPECKVSTGICGSLTFGTGELSDNGYWQYPCEECEDEWDKQEDYYDYDYEGVLYDDDAG